MIVEARVTIHGSRGAIWAAITDIENASETISGIDAIEVLEKPANGLVGLKWRETRTLFGKPAAVEKWITDAVENEFYRTRAEEGGFVFLTTRTLAESGGVLTLAESHESRPRSFVARLQLPMLFLFRGVVMKALLRDLDDIKAVVEREPRSS